MHAGDQDQPAEHPKTILPLRLIAKTPANGFDCFQPPEGGVERQPHEPDH